MAYQVVTKSNHTFWLMTSNGNWVSSHHSRDEAIAACRAWFKCSPIVRHPQHTQPNPAYTLLMGLKKAAIQLIQYLHSAIHSK